MIQRWKLNKISKNVVTFKHLDTTVTEVTGVSVEIEIRWNGKKVTSINFKELSYNFVSYTKR